MASHGNSGFSTRHAGLAGLLIGGALWAYTEFTSTPRTAVKITAQQQRSQALLLQQKVWVAKLAQREHQLRIQKAAADKLRLETFVRKMVWLAVRHGVMAILLPGLGNFLNSKD